MRGTPPRALLALPLLAAVALAGCASGPEAAGTVRGMAVLGPTGPVCREGEPCSEPYSGPLDLVRASGGGAVRSFTARNGTFEVQAAPGDYAIRHTSPNGWPACRSEPFRVDAGRVTDVAVDCDTGIR
jgi:hypothetical protein